jgi:hypothetical protein
LEKKEANCFVFCDLSKAFDKVWHQGLLHKMKTYGITGNLFNWFKSYLKVKLQKVVIKNNSSAYCEISAGVPQLSVLVPLLFIIYINDTADKLISLSRLFAGDTSFGYSNQDTMQLKNAIAHDLNEMDIWSNNGLCHLILTKQKSGFSLIVAFQKFLISLLMENQCPLPLLLNT